ncbi:MAG: DUF1016 family protein [Pirellulales bacterium]|nr:DUF1016 family protein [Pirellulales bacterium]
MRQESLPSLPADYIELLEELKKRIRHAQVRASVAANRELIRLYWDVGRIIIERQKGRSWGKGIVDHLVADIQREFPGIEGFSERNIRRMRAFYTAYTQEVAFLPQPVAELDGRIFPQTVAEIPWGHNVILIEKIKDPLQRLWYAQKTVQCGWSRSILVHQIESDLYGREGQAITNFDRTLPAPQSDLAQQTLKDPYVFDFLTLADDAREKELHQGLLEHLRDFMLELGVGFAFVGSQYHLEVENDDYYLDLFFYHLELRAFVVIDLKAGEFKPEFAGKMNFYLSAVDDQLCHPDDHPSIGIILCKDKKKVTAEYALRNTCTPISVSEYRLTTVLPKELKSNLPTIEQLEKELKTGYQ